MSDSISREQAINRINKQREHLQPDVYPQDAIGDAAYRICAEIIERLPSAEPQWIPCSERLPEVGHNILITNRQGYTGEGEYKGHNGYHHVWYQYRWNATLWEDEVLAWMPLPKPYEGRTE